VQCGMSEIIRITQPDRSRWVFEVILLCNERVKSDEYGTGATCNREIEGRSLPRHCHNSAPSSFAEYSQVSQSVISPSTVSQSVSHSIVDVQLLGHHSESVNPCVCVCLLQGGYTESVRSINEQAGGQAGGGNQAAAVCLSIYFTAITPSQSVV
jgi:hypothetical protein